MVRALADHHAVVARDRPGDLGRQIVRLRPRADEPARAELLRELRPQALRQLDDLLVQVPRVGVEQAGLGRDGFHDARVAVPHRGDVVVAIEVAAPVGVEEPDPFTAHEMDGLVVEELVGGSKRPASALQEFVFVHGPHYQLRRGSRVGLPPEREILPANPSGRRRCTSALSCILIEQNHPHPRTLP